MKSTSSLLDKIPNCKIEPDGVFKYVQILIKNNFSDESKYVIRGFKKYKWHADNFADFASIIKIIFDLDEVYKLELEKSIQYECAGGGRINVNKDEKTIFVYGYSQNYGRCDHQLTCDIIKKEFTDFTITWSNEGY